jgi:hypothetical protein
VFWVNDGKLEKNNSDRSGQVSNGVGNPVIKNVVGINIRPVYLSACLCQKEHKNKDQEECYSFVINNVYPFFVYH